MTATKAAAIVITPSRMKSHLMLASLAASQAHLHDSKPFRPSIPDCTPAVIRPEKAPDRREPVYSWVISRGPTALGTTHHGRSELPSAQRCFGFIVNVRQAPSWCTNC